MKRSCSLIIKIFEKNWKNALIYALFGFVCTLIPFILAYLINILFNILSVGDNQKLYYITITVYSVFTVIYMFSLKTGAIYDIKTSFGINSIIKKNSIKILIENSRIIEAPGKILDSFENDIIAIQYILLTFIDFLEQIIYLIITFAILCTINWKLSLAIIIPFLFVSSFLGTTGAKYKERYEQQREDSGNHANIVTEIIQNYECIQYWGDIDSIKKRYIDKCVSRGKSEFRSNMFIHLIDYFIDSFNHICVFAFLLLSTGFILNEEITVGNITLFLSYIAAGTSYLSLFNETIYGIKNMDSSFERLCETICSESVYNVLDVDSKRKQYKVNNESINKIDIRNFRLTDKDIYHSILITSGQLVVITGPNGSGKSYFIDSLSGYTEYEGEIRVNGKKSTLTDWSIGFAAQKTHLINTSIGDNLSLFSDINYRKMEEALRFANIFDELQIEKKLDASCKIGLDGNMISEGQRQRISIARAVYNSTGLLVFDDVFSHLDKTNRQTILNNILKLDCIKILVTNDKNIIKHAHLILEMDNLCIRIHNGSSQ